MTLEWLQPLQSDPSGANKEDVSPFLFWVYLGVSIALVTMAGLMSGLTLGLMSLDELDLEVRKQQLLGSCTIAAIRLKGMSMRVTTHIGALICCQGRVDLHLSPACYELCCFSILGMQSRLLLYLVMQLLQQVCMPVC